jgi:ElaB/YqjD/DUF883 family membrane-anchored ribosome-binding protein
MSMQSGWRESAQDTRAQIAQLREEMDELLRDRVRPALRNVAGRAESGARQASGMAREQAERVSGQVRERPLLALAIIGVSAYLLGRVTAR